MFKKAFLFLVFTSSLGCSKTVFYTNAGYWKMYTKDVFGAEKALLSALVESPGNVQARYNLAMNNVNLEQLKNSLTGQNHTHGIKQWKENRDPR